MPHNSSAWVDLQIHLVVIAALLLVLSIYNWYLTAIGTVLMAALYVYSRERCRDRQERIDEYYNDVVQNVNPISNYAVNQLPLAIVILNHDGNVMWYNKEVGLWLEGRIELGVNINSVWKALVLEDIWGKDGSCVFKEQEQFYNIIHRAVLTRENNEELMALYVTDITDREMMKNSLTMRQPVLGYIQIDNYDEAMQGLTEVERTGIIVEVNNQVTEWANTLGAFIRRLTDDMYITIMDRHALEKALADKFDVIDKVRALPCENRIPVTLSMGIAVAETVSLMELGGQAQAGLDLALGRGGDQVAVFLDGKTQFYGGKAKAIEKHTRVKARVVAHALNEIVVKSDLVLIMGHHNEDFDSLGAAMGVAAMAKHLGKQVYIILSEMNEGIDKFTDIIKESNKEQELFVKVGSIESITAKKPVLFIVDTHIPSLVADDKLLKGVDDVIVIDHHRRSENFIANPLLTYLEPASSSASELVTELLMYFADDIKLTSIEATALYAGVVVDTKNFAVQAGVRTFDAVAYLRRSGADPVLVRELFRTDYETSRTKAQIISKAEMYAGGLIVGVCPDDVANAQVMAAQIADSMLRIEDVRMSLVLFKLDKAIGVSARSTGDINVQVIMEKFGGGGHQNVAGTQVADAELETLKQEIVEQSLAYIEEGDKK